MMDTTRRGTAWRIGQVLAAAGLVPLVGAASLAAPATRELRWQQLIPGDPANMSGNETLRGIFDGTKVKEFLLAPYVGACIHVPSPPANQIVLIETATPFEISGMFEAVAVTGTMRTEAMSNEIASVGYQIAAAQVERIAADK